MKIIAGTEALTLQFPKGARETIAFSELLSIHLRTLPTLSVDVDVVTLKLPPGLSFEINDADEGFREACDLLSEKFSILPEIYKRFPVPDGEVVRVYERTPSQG